MHALGPSQMPIAARYERAVKYLAKWEWKLPCALCPHLPTTLPARGELHPTRLLDVCRNCGVIALGVPFPSEHAESAAPIRLLSSVRPVWRVDAISGFLSSPVSGAGAVSKR